jgi:transketolase
MRDAFVKVLTELAPSHPEIILLTGDLGFGVLNDFASRFPRQLVNVGVAEQNMSGLAAGLALEGTSGVHLLDRQLSHAQVSRADSQ